MKEKRLKVLEGKGQTALRFFRVNGRNPRYLSYCQQASGGSRLHWSQEEQKIAKSVKSTWQSPSKSPRMGVVHFLVVKAMLCPPPAAMAMKS